MLGAHAYLSISGRFFLTKRSISAFESLFLWSSRMLEAAWTYVHYPHLCWEQRGKLLRQWQGRESDPCWLSSNPVAVRSEGWVALTGGDSPVTVLHWPAVAFLLSWFHQTLMTKNQVMASSQLAHLCHLLRVLHQGLSVQPADPKAALVFVPWSLQNRIGPCTFY